MSTTQQVTWILGYVVSSARYFKVKISLKEDFPKPSMSSKAETTA